MHDDTSKTGSDDKQDEPENRKQDEPETRKQRARRRIREWQIRQHLARGLAYGVGSGAVSLLVVWVQTRY